MGAPNARTDVPGRPTGVSNSRTDGPSWCDDRAVTDGIEPPPHLTPGPVAAEPTPFEAMGGMPFFERLVGAFYDRVAVDPVLRALYPETDLSPARRRLTLFLTQFWGGPSTYSAERGHPRLRSRHLRFEIGACERDHWLEAMQAALAEVGAPEPWADELRRYFESAAEALRNVER